MRYRPFTSAGRSISAITLVLDGAAVRDADPLKLIYAALEAGVNGFELATDHPRVTAALQTAVAAVGRSMVVLMLRLGHDGLGGAEAFTPEGIERSIDLTLAATGADHFDAVILERPGPGELTPRAVAKLEQARGALKTRMTGLAGDDAVADAYLASGDFNLLATPFNLRSGWVERNRIKGAVQRNMTIVGYDFAIDASNPVDEARPKGLARFFRRPDPRIVHAYDFLNDTRDWGSDEICLAFALTEPSLATVRVRPKSLAHLEKLAACADRELPTGVSAQIEMARFAAVEGRAPA